MSYAENGTSRDGQPIIPKSWGITLDESQQFTPGRPMNIRAGFISIYTPRLAPPFDIETYLERFHDLDTGNKISSLYLNSFTFHVDEALVKSKTFTLEVKRGHYNSMYKLKPGEKVLSVDFHKSLDTVEADETLPDPYDAVEADETLPDLLKATYSYDRKRQDIVLDEIILGGMFSPIDSEAEDFTFTIARDGNGGQSAEHWNFADSGHKYSFLSNPVMLSHPENYRAWMVAENMSSPFKYNIEWWVQQIEERGLALTILQTDLEREVVKKIVVPIRVSRQEFDDALDVSKPYETVNGLPEVGWTKVPHILGLSMGFSNREPEDDERRAIPKYPEGHDDPDQ
ncbi:MAG TPA: hypothetical protein VG965_04120 [Patescibacteria group bacterium]|nr:hypothetical protein [Patescibacteria group bacterium]